MIFVDTNVFMYAVGRSHPLRDQAREFFLSAKREGRALCTSAEVLQELLHIYMAAARPQTLDAAFVLLEGTVTDLLPLEVEDVRLARELVDSYSALGARDLVHLATCRRRNIRVMHTYDRALASAFGATFGQ